MKGTLFRELKRRHVYRVAVAYVVVAWLVIQAASTFVPALHLPDALTTMIVLVVALGFPIALVVAWAFELTPEGVRRTEPADSPNARPPEHHRYVGRKLDFIIIGVLVVAVTLLAWRQWGLHEATQTRSPATPAVSNKPSASASPPAAASSASIAAAIPQKSIAVLPFENLSADKNNDYFVAGMQDLVLTKLAGIGELKVISRTSTMKYATHPDDLKTIAAQLGVANILEGSVQKAGNSVLINVQLINAQTDAHIWAQAYTRTLDNVFGVEGEVAEKIADALKTKLSPAETKRLATALSADAQANDLFLRAEYFFNRGTAHVNSTDLKQAIPLYRQALARVPNFALAHARLSHSESWLAFDGGFGEDVKQLDQDARTHAEEALKLAPDLAESHLAIGYCDYYGKSDYDAALTAFAAALRIRPNDASVLLARGFVLRRQGKFDEAIDALEQALTHDPRNGLVANILGETYMATSRYVDAERALLHALALDPGNNAAKLNYAASIALRTGDVEQSLAAAQGNSVRMKRLRVSLLFFQRKYRDAIALLESIPDTPDNFPGGAKDTFMGYLYRLSGDNARARVRYAKDLPGLRERLPALANHPLAMAQLWNVIAAAELGLGKTDAGLAASKAALAAAQKSGDQLDGPGVVLDAAENYAEARRADEAVSLAARALATPGIGSHYSPAFLWIDPEWDPIRKDPAFQALLKKYAKYRPAKVPADASG